jgi:alpha-amylase/alpha-mannosidase (GH57 family)
MHVAILWHMHQPIYRDAETRRYRLPWVGYHAAKSYYQMARLVGQMEFPCTFNFVPCLLEQLKEYAEGKADDPYLEAMRQAPEKLRAEQFRLLQKIVPEEKDKEKIQLAALQSYFSPLVKLDDNKENLLEMQKRIFESIIPLYRQLAEKGVIEITTSPYYHPLLPLIFDLSSADGEKLPSFPFRHPEDGRLQLEKGMAYFQEIFGQLPRGVWPSEGGISQEVAEAAFEQGFSYCVTDETVLWKSLGRQKDARLLYEPYSCKSLSVFFRDRELSDLIGFEYQRLEPEAAVADFLKRLAERRNSSADNSICVIALDGENPWGSYHDNGVPFLQEFFTALKQEEGIELTTFNRYLAKNKAQKQIRLAPGTWLGSFSKWVGSEAKNRAWDRLSRARELCGPLEEILIAEGSDWFWWSGEPNTEDFDLLFQSYLQKAYARAGLREKP